jgi:porin
MHKLFALSLALLAPTFAQAQDAPKAWSYSGNYTADLIGVVSGGVDQDVRYLDNFGLQLNYDGSAHGLKGITATIGLIYNNKASISELTSDAQGISNIETGSAAVRPYETWIAKTWGEDAAMIKGGLIDLNGSFDAPGASALFIHPSHGINPAFSQTGRNGPSIFPVLGLGLVGQAKVSDALQVRLGAFDAVPGDPDKPNRVDLAWRESDGALIVGEAELNLGKTRFVAGTWGYTRDSDALSVLDAPARNFGVYGTAEYQHSDAITYFVRGGRTNKKLNLIENYVAAGAVWTGPFRARKEDQLGIAIAHARFGSNVVTAFALQEAETNIELTYAAPLTQSFTLQGDVQYIANPSGALLADNAVVVGVRMKYTFAP